MLMKLKPGYILKFNFFNGSRIKGRLSNYFHGTYRRYLSALTNAFTYRQNMCQENYRVCQAWRNLEYTLCYKNHRTWSSKNAATVLSWNCRTLQRIV